MQNKEWLKSVLDEVADLALFQSPRRVDCSGVEDFVALEGEIIIESRKVTLRLVLDPSFPLVLPRFFLHPWNALGFIPHIDQRGYICFTDTEGLIFDRYRPVEIVEESFHRVIQVLTDGATGQNHADFVDEFNVYWGYLPNTVPVISLLDPTDEVESVIIAFAKNKPLCIARTRNEITEFFNNAEDLKYTFRKALYLPLKPGSLLVPPCPDGTFWTTEETQSLLLSNITDTNRVRLRKLAKKYSHVREYVIAMLPRPSGGEVLFGIAYEQTNKMHPLQKGGEARRLLPLLINRFDKTHIIRRGGGDVSLSGKRALLAGCGAIGGYIAFELARAGIQQLTLVDPDKLNPENTFRHVLGRQYWWNPKSEALRSAIELQLPYLRVTSFPRTIEQTLNDGTINLVSYDLVVLALGNPTVELEINEKLLEMQKHPPALFAWLEPLGIGGHVLLAGNTPDGCFECLYTPLTDDGTYLENRAAFAAPGQMFGQALSGCGSLYTPYGSVDAVRTAALAVKLSIDVLTGKERGNPLLSWKGDATLFNEKGFCLSRRFNATEDELYRQRYMYKNPRCRACGNRGGSDT